MKNIWICRLLKILPRMQSANVYTGKQFQQTAFSLFFLFSPEISVQENLHEVANSQYFLGKLINLYQQSAARGC